jgi:hypothetical protein
MDPLRFLTGEKDSAFWILAKKTDHSGSLVLDSFSRTSRGMAVACNPVFLRV